VSVTFEHKFFEGGPLLVVTAKHRERWFALHFHQKDNLKRQLYERVPARSFLFYYPSLASVNNTNFANTFIHATLKKNKKIPAPMSLETVSLVISMVVA
jgi:hypothetical protein